MSLEEKLNCRCDALAKDALVTAIAESSYIRSEFPFEDVRVYINGEKLITSARRTFHDHHSYERAKTAFDRKGLVNSEDFDLIYWDCMPSVLQRFPREFRTWLSKHVSGCCGVNRFLSKWDKKVKNICPSCKRPNETVLHITKCTDPGRSKLFDENVDELRVWLSRHDTPPELTHLLISYLLHRGTKPMSSFLSSNSIYTAMATAHDRLGWRSFLEGHITKVLVQIMHDHLLNSTSRFTATYWAREFSSRLIILTHHQWRHRNAHLHYKGKEHKSAQEHADVMARTRELTRLDSSELLPQFRDLLDAEDFDALFEGPTVARQYWICEVEAALATTAIHQRNKKKRKRQHHLPPPPSHNHPISRKRHHQQTISRFFSPISPSVSDISSPSTPPEISERGFKYKKRRKK